MPVDYSRFDHIGAEDDAEEARERAERTRQLSSRPDLQGTMQQLQQLQATDPSKLDQLQSELHAMQSSISAEKARRAERGGAGRLSEEERQLSSQHGSSLEASLGQSRGAMEEQLDQLRLETELLNEQQRRLEQLAAAGDARSIVEFMQSQACVAKKCRTPTINFRGK